MESCQNLDVPPSPLFSDEELKELKDPTFWIDFDTASADPAIWKDLDTAPPPSPFGSVDSLLLPPLPPLFPEINDRKNINENDEKLSNDNETVLDHPNAMSEPIVDGTCQASSCPLPPLSPQAKDHEPSQAKDHEPNEHKSKFGVWENEMRRNVILDKLSQTSHVRSKDDFCKIFFKKYRISKYAGSKETETKNIVLTFILWAILNDKCLKNMSLITLKNVSLIWRLKNYLTQPKLGNTFERLKSLWNKDCCMFKEFYKVRKIVRSEMKVTKEI